MRREIDMDLSTIVLIIVAVIITIIVVIDQRNRGDK